MSDDAPEQPGTAPQAETAARAARKLSTLVLALAALAGLLLRLRMYLLDRSLWLDPAMLALNLVDRSYGELFGRLDMYQAAPVGFLLTSKAIAAPFDYSEAALELLPLLFGAAALLLFWPLCVEILGPSPAPVAFVPFAFGSAAIYYSGEFKQYSAELLTTILVLLLAHRTLRSGLGVRWTAAWTVAAVAALWFSHAVAFVIAGSGVTLLLVALRRRDGRAIRRLILAGILVTVHAAVMFLAHVRPALSDGLFYYHREAYPPTYPFSLEALRWWARALWDYPFAPLGFRGPVLQALASPLPLAAALVGALAWTLPRGRRATAALMILPLVLLGLASQQHFYPFPTGQNDIHARLLLFTVPLVLLLIAAGVAVAARASPWPRSTLLALGLAVASDPIVTMFRPSIMRQEMAPLVTALRTELAADDQLFIDVAATPAFRFYTRHQTIPFASGFPPRDTAGTPRLWLVLAGDGRDAKSAARAHLGGQRCATIQARDFQGLLLFRCDRTDEALPP